MATREQLDQIDEGDYLEGGEADKEKQAEHLRMALLDSFGVALTKSRGEAIAGRQTSGIELLWIEDEEFYEGIDDINRMDEQHSRLYKPLASGQSNNQAAPLKGRSRVFPNITAPYTDAAAAHVADILIPNDDAPWSVESTPIPEIEHLADLYVEEKTQQPVGSGGFLGRLRKMLSAGQDNSQAMLGNLPQEASVTPEQAFQQREIAVMKAEGVTKRIWDWQSESGFNGQAREVIEDAARMGVGILKGPFGQQHELLKWGSPPPQKNEDGNPIVNQELANGADQLYRIVEIRPGSERVEPWNFYPDPDCGENIQDGSYVWERKYITKSKLRKLKLNPEYLEDQIDLVLIEGPMRAIAPTDSNVYMTVDTTLKNKYEMWIYHGTAEKDQLMAAGVDIEGEEDPSLYCRVVMINGKVILASMPAVDYGGFPYDPFCWRKRKGHWAGIGVPRSIRTAQKIVVGATRTLMDNAGLAGGPLIVFKQGVVRPADGVAGIAPRKIYYIAKDDTTIADATKAIGTVKVDILVDEMIRIIELGLKLAEDTSGFPAMMQGQLGTAPDRVGIVQVLDKNTNAIKRRIARNFSDQLMAPHIKRYVIWHTMYGPENERGGDLIVNVKGYQMLVERDIQNQQLPQLYQLSQDPRTRLDPEKITEQLLRAWHIPLKEVQFDDQEWEKLLQQWQQVLASAGGEDPRITVAKINVQGKLKSEEYKGATEISRQRHDKEVKETDRQFTLMLSAVDRETQQLLQQGVRQDVVAKLRNDLVKEVMKIRSTMQLARMEAPADALPKPPIEPAGTARAGHSYTE